MRRRRFTRHLTLILMMALWLIAGVKAFANPRWSPATKTNVSTKSAPLSARPLKLGSEQMLLSSADGKGLKQVLTYFPRGEKASEWTIRFEIFRVEGNDPIAKARSELAEALASRGNDRYAGAQLLTTKSGESVFLDQYRTEGERIESMLTRYFKKDDTIVVYRWTRRMLTARVPAEAGAKHLEIMRFIERERQKRVDLITDFATKKDIPHMSKDDPMGMRPLSAKPKSQP